MNAINLPLSPIPFELDPEDTMLGNCLQPLCMSLTLPCTPMPLNAFSF